MSASHFIAADVGNARIKLGLFAADCAANFPEPLHTLPLVGKEPELDWVEPWLAEGSQGNEPASYLSWWLASVNRPAATRLIDWLHEHRPGDRVILLASGDLPLDVRLERPDMVGIDRLVDAVAVNRLRDAGRPAVIVDVGTAITVDLVSADGAFLGGAILPGIHMAARALHHFTDLLPLVDVSDLTTPPAVLGISTESAMKSGLFWGAVGAIRQLIDALGKTLSRSESQVFLTGGAGAAVGKLLGPETRHVPNLTLSGIAQIALERNAYDATARGRAS
jgi:type III pantothenate kinase